MRRVWVGNGEGGCSGDLASYESIRAYTIGMDETAFTTMKYQTVENSYNAALSAASRYVQMSLLSYLQIQNL